MGARREFTERIGKLPGNTPGDHRKKTIRLITRMPEATGLVGPPKILGNLRWFHHRRWRLYCLYSIFSGAFEFWLHSSEANWGL
ncbi:hypothetical protein B296_00004229 [Ensete ventricosum]|uniref:Uncharacterized protein n=1 Tax=Ensete ventricosum TaxID=4639 RepID=A0A427AAJ1_ENSVE|nr:hypothetical protein B296_00004229 [Ensete ventricosum]